MTFADSSQLPPLTPSIHLTADEFEVIFQVTKELHILPRAALEGAGWGTDDIDRLLSMARGIRGRMGGVPFVRVDLEVPGTDEGIPAPPSVSELKQGEASIKVMVGALPYRLGREWRGLAEAVVSSLGPRELYLRTGYRADDVLMAIRQLSVGVA
jgi:hypothetical protein